MDADKLEAALRGRGRRHDKEDGEKVLAAAKKVAEAAVNKGSDEAEKSSGDKARIQKIDQEVYNKLLTSVKMEIAQLRVILESVEAKEKERVWIKNQTQGDLDDNRLVDGATGEHTIFKKRGNHDPLFGRIQKRPKRLCFCMDVSSSMSRFNGSDRRLDAMIACSCMVMEAFSGFEHKYDYSLIGHSGEAHDIEFVKFGQPPKTRAERADVVQRMASHAGFCMSGDNTLACAYHACKLTMAEEADDFFVFLLSDANLSQYGVTSNTMRQALMSEAKVNPYAIFIAGELEAELIRRELPTGMCYICLDTKLLPNIFKEIFSRSVLNSKL